MRGSWRLLFLLILAHYAGAATTPKAASKAPASTTRPNVIIITLDTTRADRMGFLGSKLGLTPNLDALAKQSTVFNRAYSHVPLTPPSHATILSGTYPQFNHLRYMGDPLSKTLPYLPDILHKRGYRTAAFVGCNILDPKNVAIGFDRGFDVYDAGYHNRKHGEDRYKSFERRAGEVADHALTWLNKRPAGPFFMWVHFYDAHDPYDPPEPFKTRYQSDPYDGEIAYTDTAVAKIIAALRASGLYDETLIAVMADHGEAFGEHGEHHHGIFLYDETIHVPLIMKLPAKRTAGKAVDARVGLIDVTPTILETLGLPIPPEVQGKSLVGLMKAAPGQSPSGGEEATADRAMYAESDYGHRAFGWSALRSWRSGKYLYVQSPKRELYDETTDPATTHNVADSSKAVTDTLASQLQTFRQSTSAAGNVQTKLSVDQAQSLRALGYLGSESSESTAGNEEGPDPKDDIGIANVFHDALTDMENERYSDAVSKLEKIVAQEPNTNMAYLELGRAYVHVKEYEKAIPPLQRAVEKSPDDVLGRYELAQAFVKTGRWEEAVPHLQLVADRTPQSAEMHFNLAVALMKTNRMPEAVKAFEETLKIEPTNFRANLLLGRLYGMQQDGKSALPYLLAAAKIDPKSLEAHMFLANVYLELGQMQKAERERDLVQKLRSSGIQE